VTARDGLLLNRLHMMAGAIRPDNDRKLAASGKASIGAWESDLCDFTTNHRPSRELGLSSDLIRERVLKRTITNA